jgi:hypothetical protein
MNDSGIGNALLSVVVIGLLGAYSLWVGWRRTRSTGTPPLTVTELLSLLITRLFWHERLDEFRQRLGHYDYIRASGRNHLRGGGCLLLVALAQAALLAVFLLTRPGPGGP